MTNLQALKTLYVSLGGSSATVADLVENADVINAIATLITSGALKELPDVDSEDNGKVLKVVDGKWALGSDLTE